MKHKNIALAVALLMSVGAFAQHNEEVTIEGTYRPKVNKVDKILMQAKTPQQSFEMPSSEVRVLDIEHRFPLELEKLGALNYNGKNSQAPEPAKNFLMAGFGLRISPVFLYKHNSNLTKNLGLGVGIKHYSSWGDIKDYAPSSFMNNAFNIGLTSSKYKSVQLGVDVYYKNDMYHYYGVNLAETPLTDAQVALFCPRQTYNTVGGHFGLVSTSTRVGELSHSGDIDYHFTFDNTYAREHFVGAEYGFGYAQNWWGSKSHPQKIGMDLAIQYDYFGQNDLYFMKVNPFFEMGDEFFKLHLGVRLDGVNRVQNKDEFLGVYPDVSGSLFVLNKKLEFYAGLNGGRKLLTYSDIINENPFVGSDISVRAKNVKLGFDGGVRTNIGEVIDLHLGVRYRHTDNDPFYLVQGKMAGGYAVENMFDVFYDESYLTSVLADVRWLAFDKVTVDAGATFNNYRLTVLDQPLYRPKYEARLKLNYCPVQSLSLYSSFLFQDGLFARNQSPLLTVPSMELKPVMDLGLGADYRFNDQLGVFVKVNNLLHQKYQLYYNYPVNGIEFFAGLKMTF